MKEKMKAFWNEHSEEITAYVAISAITALSMVVGYKLGMLTEDRNWYRYIISIYGKKLEGQSSK